MWKFNYFRENGGKVEFGPFASEGEAQIERDKIISFGAFCSEPFEVSEETPNKSRSYINNKIRSFESYFYKEVAILKEISIPCYIFYDFLMIALKRVNIFIKAIAPSAYRAEYLLRITDIIKFQARFYGNKDSFLYRDNLISKELFRLAEKVEARLSL